MENLKKMEYPGRFIIIGRTNEGSNVVTYGLTGRSPSSQARRLRQVGNVVEIEVTDEAILAKGNPALLVYEAMIVERNRVYASNGAQTRLIRDRGEIFQESGPAGILENATNLAHHMEGEVDIISFEPDRPNWTPRIHGCVTGDMAAFQIISRGKYGKRKIETYEITLENGNGCLVATYDGSNTDPLPSFTGEPREIGLPWSTPQGIAENVWDALPQKLVVSVAAIVTPPDSSTFGVGIINRNN